MTEPQDGADSIAQNNTDNADNKRLAALEAEVKTLRGRVAELSPDEPAPKAMLEWLERDGGAATQKSLLDDPHKHVEFLEKFGAAAFSKLARR